MRRTGAFISSGRWSKSGLTDEELSQITVPALVSPWVGQTPDGLHPRHSAEQLYRLLPNAQWVEFSDRWTDAEMEAINEPYALSQKQTQLYMPFLLDWLKSLDDRVEEVSP